MRTVGDLSHAILGLLKDDDAGRVALYHFLKNFCRPDDPVTPETIDHFYSEALQIPNWQSRRQELHRDIQELLQRFYSQSGSPFRLDQVWNVGRMQLILLEQPENLYTTVRNYEQSSMKEGENLRVLQESETRALVVRRAGNGEVTVRTYPNLVRIQGDRLLPVGPDQEIFYDAGLDLRPGCVNKIRHALHSQCRFEINAQGVIEAQFIAGFAFRQTQIIKITNVNQESRIFYPLKQLERFYVHRPSDPYYMEIISSLDRALQMLLSGAEGALSFAQQAFDGGQIAFDQIFPDDKALYMRLKELAKWIRSREVKIAQTPEIHR